MSTLSPTVLQYGVINDTGLLWTNLPAGALVNVGRPPASLTELWIQFDFTAGDVLALTGGTFDLLLQQTGFNYNFDIIVAQAPVLQDFSNTFLPNTINRLIQPDAIGTVNFAAPVAQTFPLLLHTASGAATPLLAGARAGNGSLNFDSSGVRRLALGFRISPIAPSAVGTIAITNVTFTGESEVTGDSDNRGIPGIDRQVECPRCGTLELERNLTKDGVQKGLLVCSDCFDPPTPPSNFSWPFGS